jgi:hypothetical protein
MAASIPSQDQVMAQLRIIIPALGTVITTIGVSSTAVGHWEGLIMASAGPIAYAICGVWSLVVNTQKAKVQTVEAMPGVEHITVNAQATQVLASMAVDPASPKVAPTPADAAQVTAIAKGS